MADKPKPVRSVLMDALQNLAPKDLKRFTEELWIREEKPRIPRGEVVGKDYTEVANVMVSALDKINAVNVAVEILNNIGCSGEATRLMEEAGSLR